MTETPQERAQETATTVDQSPRPEVAGPAPGGAPTMLGQMAGQIGGAALQRKILQRRAQRAGGGHDDAGVHQAAAQGTSGAGSSLPHLDTIQKSFGKHDVTGVQAHTDGPAANAAGAMGAEAFATGNHVAFAGAPSLHTAAHEAAHVVQQRAGVHLKGGVGEEGDTYEKHADRVADKVVQGESAESLLDQHAGGGAAPTQAPTQRKVQLKGGRGRRGRGRGGQGPTGGGGGAKSTAVALYTGGQSGPKGGPGGETSPSAKGGSAEKSTALTVYSGGQPGKGGESTEKSTALTVYNGGQPGKGGESAEKSTAVVVHGGGERGGGQPSGEMCGIDDGPAAEPLMLADRAWGEIEAERAGPSTTDRIGMGIDAGADILDVIEALAKAKEEHGEGNKGGTVAAVSGAMGAGVSAAANLGGAGGAIGGGTMDKAGGAASALKIVNQAHEVYKSVDEAWKAYQDGGFSAELAVKVGAVVEKGADVAGSALTIGKAFLGQAELAESLGPAVEMLKRAMVVFERLLQAREAWQQWDILDKDKGKSGRWNERRIKQADDAMIELVRDRFKQNVLEIVVNGGGLVAVASLNPVAIVGAKGVELASKAYIGGLRTAREWGLWYTDQSKTTDGRRKLAEEIVFLRQAHLFKAAGVAPSSTVDEVHKALLQGN